MSKPQRKQLSKEEATAAVASCLGDDFRQQTMPAWKPLYSPAPVLSALWIIGVVLCILGIVAIIVTTDIRQISVPYGDKCGNSTPCKVTVDIQKPLRLPVAVYYELRGFYQNYRTYTTSRSQEQLEGNVILDPKILSECSPMLKRNTSGGSDEVFFPCGLVAWSHFNDSFSLGVITQNSSTEQSLKLEKKNIAPKYNRDRYRKDPGENITGVRVVDDITDEDFLVWMRHASFPRFKKLYRRIETGVNTEAKEIPAGKLVVHVDENVFPVNEFGSKHLVLTEISWLGGKNTLLGYLLFVGSGIYLIFAIVLTWVEIIHPRKMGDISRISWVHSAEVERESAEREAKILRLEREGKSDGKDEGGAYISAMFEVNDVAEKKGRVVSFE